VKAITAPEPGGPEALRLVDVPDPQPGEDDLLVEVAATSVNRADTLQRKGHYPPPPGASDVLGLEMAGTVIETGAGVTGWTVGDRVCAVLPGGGYAERAVVPASVALRVPDGVDLVEAGAIAEVFATAHDNLVTRGRLRAGETVLLHGGSSGVGTAGIQIAKRLGARVIVTAGSDHKLSACAKLGADAGIDYRRDDFAARVGELTGGRGVDVILDIVGADYLDANLKSLATEGRLVIIGLMSGPKTEINLGRLLVHRLTVTASTLRARSTEEKAAVADALRREVMPGFDDGSLRPVIDRIFDLEDAAEAHARMESSEHIGKLVLRVP
jgi:putative PIG3 family NAD(P)H quinone oxidoreductase